MPFDNGVSFYAKGKCDITVFFPNGEIKCQYCRFCRSESDLKRWWCRLTDEMIFFPFQGVGAKCPIEINEEIEEV